MGVIQVPGRLSGKNYSLKIKGDTPSETEQARILNFVAEKEAEFVSEYEQLLGKPIPEPDDGTALGRGISRGAAGIKSTAGTTLETIGQQTGIASLANFGRGMEEAAGLRQFDLSLTQPPRMSAKDVSETKGFFPKIGAGLTYAGELAGEQIPQFGTGLVGGAAGAIGGGLLAGPVGAVAGFGVGSGLTEAPLLFGANVQRQEEEVAQGRKDEVDLGDALGATVGQAALTAIANAIGAKGLTVVKGGLFTRAGAGAAIGAPVEGLNEVGQAVLERYQAGLPLDTPDAIEEYIESGVAGAVLGGGAGALGGVAVGKSKEVEPVEKPPELLEFEDGEIDLKPRTVEQEEIASNFAAEMAKQDAADGVEYQPTPSPVDATTLPFDQIADAPRTAVAEPDKTIDAPISPSPEILTDELVDQLGVGKAKSAPLRKFVGLPISDPKVTKALENRTKSEKISPEAKELAGKLISATQAVPKAAPKAAPQEALDVSQIEAPQAAPQAAPQEALDVSQIEAPQAITEIAPKVELPLAPEAALNVPQLAVPEVEPEVTSQAAPEVIQQTIPQAVTQDQAQLPAQAATYPVEETNVTKTTEAQPSEMGTGLPDSSPSVAELGQTDSYIGSPQGVEASRSAGLGRGLPSPLRDKLAKKPQRDPLTQEQANTALVASYMSRTTEAYRKATSVFGGINNPKSWSMLKDNLTPEDKVSVLDLLGRVDLAAKTKTKRIETDQGFTPSEAAARTYFSKTLRPVDAIEIMVHDAIAGYGNFRQSDIDKMSPELAELFKGTGNKKALLALEWVRQNLSAAANTQKNKLVERDLQELRAVEKLTSLEEGIDRNARVNKIEEVDETARDYMDTVDDFKAADKNRKSLLKAAGFIQSAMRASSLAALDQDMHYATRAALLNGDLRGALLAVAATTPNQELRFLANTFARFVGTTRVRVVPAEYMTGEFGTDYGRFYQTNENGDPDYQNIIVLNGEKGLNNHTLMHEMAHAVTAQLLYLNPSHPAIKQLETLYMDVRSAFGKPGQTKFGSDFYGLTNLSEFIAEAFGRVALGQNDNGLRDLMKRVTYTEARGNPRELPLTAWERFKEIIGNLARTLGGRPTKPYPRRVTNEMGVTRTNALDEFDKLMGGLLSTAPQVLPDAVFQKLKQDMETGRTMINNALVSARTWNPAAKSDLSAYMEVAIPNSVRRALLGLLQLEWFDDLAGKYYPQIKKFKEVEDRKRGYLNTLVSQSKATVGDLADFSNSEPELFTNLMAIQGRATIEEVDPTKPVSTYKDDKEKTAIWHELNRELNKDGSGKSRALFKKVRNMYSAYTKEVREALNLRIKDIAEDPAVQKTLLEQLMAKLEDAGAIDPYFSLLRSGDYRLVYSGIDPSSLKETLYVQGFNSLADLRRFRARLEEAKGADGQPVAYDFRESMVPKPKLTEGGRRVPTDFARGAINIINSTAPTGSDKAAQDRAARAVEAIQEMFIDFTPEASLLKSFSKRKNRRGFIGDMTPIGVADTPASMVRALADKSSTLSYQVTGLRFGAEMQKLIDQSLITEDNLNRDSDLTIGEKQAIAAYGEEFRDRVRIVQNPSNSKTSQFLTGTTFAMTLGLNVSAGINTLMQIPMIGVTELAGKYGLRPALKALGFGVGAVFNTGRTQRNLSYGEDPALMEQRDNESLNNLGSLVNYFEVDNAGNYILRTDRPIPKKLRKDLADMDVLVQTMSEKGMLANSMVQEMLDADPGFLQKMNNVMGFMHHQGERFNRQVMAVAAYQLELGKLSKDNPTVTREMKLQAAEQAIDITERVNGSIGMGSSPRHAMNSVGRVIFMFKKFGLHMARYIINTANEALQGADKETRQIARYQIIGMLGTTAVFAGVQGLPFFGELVSLFNLLFTEDDEEPAEVIIQKYLQEPFYNGALNYAFGIEIASRISMSGLIFRENMIDKDQSALYNLFEMFGGPAVGLFMNAERAQELIAQGDLYRGIEATMPAFLKNMMKSGRYATEGALTLRGDEIVPLTGPEIALQFLGYTPGVYARTQERVSAEKKIDTAILEKKRKIYRKYYQAYLAGDFVEMREVLKEAIEFSQSNPEQAITGETLARSLNANLKRSSEMVAGRTFNPKRVAQVQDSLDNEYDPDVTMWGS